VSFTTKLYKYDTKGDLKERQRSISFTVCITEPAETPILPHTVEIQTRGQGSVPAESVPVLVQSNLVYLGDIVPDVSSTVAAITDAKKASMSMEMAPWATLLGKVEKFNSLLDKIAGVRAFIQIYIRMRKTIFYSCIHMQKQPGMSYLQHPK
jgi:hypothetical protein